MSAKITQLSGRSEVAEFWIDEAVVSIGSSESCSVRIPDLEAEACLLQYHDGTYILHNRGSQAIRVAAQRVQPGEAILWEDGEKARLNGLVAVQLAADGPPEPKRRQDAEDDAAGDALEATSPGRTSMQLAVTAVCVVAAVAMLLSAMSKDPQQAPSVAFEALAASLQAEPTSTDSVAGYILGTLQQARHHELRNDRDLALRLYGEIRNYLFNKSHAAAVLSPPVEDQVESFVRDRLEMLCH